MNPYDLLIMERKDQIRKLKEEIKELKRHKKESEA
jgi:hypothetical protein